MKYLSHAAAFSELEAATKFTSNNVQLIGMEIILVPVIFSGKLIKLQQLLNLVGSVFTHIAFLSKLKAFQNFDLNIIRDFLTVPLLIVWPVLFFSRNKLLFVINHNLQKTQQNWVEKACLQLLLKFGCRFLFLEFQNQNIRTFGISDPNRHLTLPFPVGKFYAPPKLTKSKYTVGIIGFIRAEKKSMLLIDAVTKAAAETNFNVLIGTPQKIKLSDISNPRNCEIKLIDTEAYDSYLRAIESCDIVAFNYSPSEYYWRHSGVIAECIGKQKYVICPNLPLISSQVLWPERVGHTFETLSEIENILREFHKTRQKLVANFQSHYDARSAKSAAKKLDDFCIQIGI